MKQIRWLVPGLVMGMDDTRTHREPARYLHQVKDLASRYVLDPRTGDFPAGADVVENLRRLVFRHRAPLFLKRDNGSNLNHQDVNDVMEEFSIIPLNSPPHYPQYNGSV